jgi:Xaa-Pro aminopeptidase
MNLLLYNGWEFDPNFYYQTKLDIDHSFLLVAGARKTLFVSSMNQAIARSSFKGKVVVYTDAIKTLTPYIRGKTVHIDGASISASMAARLKRCCRLKDYSSELFLNRRKKNDNEVGYIRKAAKLTKEIIASLDLTGGKTELDIKQQLLIQTLEMGLEPAFEPIVSTDQNTAYPHYHSGRKKLGSLVLVDYGVRYEHYCSDITRCFILDNDLKKKEEYERLKDICYFITDSLPNLGNGKDVAILAKDLVAKAGFPEMIHSIGHGVGLDIHESPRLGMKSDDPLSGAVMAIEPGAYFKRYGLRYEETVYNDGKRARIL